MNEKHTPRFLVAAASSGSGKTLITCGILQVLKNRGLQVASFKCGPDYIDPMFHSRVIGTKSRNLDTFFADTDTVRYLLKKNAADCDIAVLEGVMGYYDGLAGTSEKASTYDVASCTGTPVVFLVNCKGMSLSVVPFLKGFLEYRKDSGIRGVILNQVSPMMYPRMKKMIEEELPVRVYGYVPVVRDCVLESRHLGLVMPDEIDGLREKLQKLAGILKDTLDVDGLLELAESSVPLTSSVQTAQMISVSQKIRIGVARDEAFCFFYEDNLEFLQEMGAELVYFSPVHDSRLPEHLDGLLLHGGYPELYAGQLSNNLSMRNSIRLALENGMPHMAECGGFMYLHEQMEDMDGHFWPMVGTVPGTVYRTDHLHRFGYITLQEGTCFGQETPPIPAHEFHYFDSENCGEDYLAQKPNSKRSWRCIHSDERRMVGFPHLYYYGCKAIPEAFLRAAARYGRKEIL